MNNALADSPLHAPPAPRSTFSLGVVLLAAGRSRRMGRPKLLLPWGNTSVLGHLLEQWRQLEPAQIAVVCAQADEALNSELDQLGFPQASRIFNPAPERGMFSSIQCAAGWAGWSSPLTHWVIVLGDQPQVRVVTLSTLLQWSAAHLQSVSQPARHGRPRHPVILPGARFRELAQTSAATLKEYLDSVPAAVCEIDDPGLELDMDRPEDYEKALQLWGGGRRSSQPRSLANTPFLPPNPDLKKR